MFIRVHNMQANTELNINTRNIVSFEPANDGKNSKIFLSNGIQVIVRETNRMLRHAVSAGARPAENSAKA